MITLEAEIREKATNNDKLRKEGKIPAVYYGKKAESTPITLTEKDFMKAWKTAGESSVVSIKTPNGVVETLIHDVTFDPVTDRPVHADFYVFEKGKKVEISIPLNFVGVSPVVKDLGGRLVKALQEVKISAEPQNLPHEIEVDISALVDFDSQILAGQLKMPNGVLLLELPTEVVAVAARPQEEEKEEAPVDLSSIEVEKKGKEATEGAEAEAPAEESK